MSGSERAKEELGNEGKDFRGARAVETLLQEFSFQFEKKKGSH